ncbi:MAG: hypothetical protein IJZ27_03185 [Treponema sp.]|nr:hypothetical protein [Treponema sp.]
MEHFERVSEQLCCEGMGSMGAGAIAEPEVARFFVFEKGSNVTDSKTKNASIKNKKTATKIKF